MAFGRDGSIHPDENLLTAFAERTLAKSERQDVLEHLSSCRHCRDVVFLAQQAAAEEALQVAPAPDKSIAGGWWLGRRHWGIVLAGGAVAALLIATSLRLYHGVDRAQVPPSSVAGAKTPAAPANLPARKNAVGAAPVAPTGSIETTEKPHLARREITPPRVTVVVPPNVAAASASGVGAGSGSAAAVGVGASSGVATGTGTAGGVGSGRGAGIGAAAGGSYSGGNFRAGAAGGVEGGVPGAPPKPQAQARASNTTTIPPVILQPGAATQTVDVTSAQPLLQTGDAAISTSFILPDGNHFAIRDGAMQSCIAQTCSPVKSPSQAQIISLAADAGTVMAVDAKGALFVSHNEGKHWKKSHAHWQGRAMIVTLVSSAIVSPATNRAAVAASPAPPAPGSPPDQLQIFQLQNDQGQVWLSSDEGKTWHLK